MLRLSSWKDRWKLRRKGVSEILSNLMIAAIVVALSTVIVLWGTNIFSSLQGSSNTYYMSRREALLENLVIEHVHFGSDDVTVYLRNVGNIELNITSIYVTNVNGSQDIVSNPDAKILVQELKSIIVSGWSPVSGDTYQIIATTGRGNKVVEFWSNPS